MDIKEKIKEVKVDDLPQEWKDFFELYSIVVKEISGLSKNALRRLLLNISSFPMEDQSIKISHPEEVSVYEKLTKMKVFYGFVAIQQYLSSQKQEKKEDGE